MNDDDDYCRGREKFKCFTYVRTYNFIKRNRSRYLFLFCVCSQNQCFPHKMKFHINKSLIMLSGLKITRKNEKRQAETTGMDGCECTRTHWSWELRVDEVDVLASEWRKHIKILIKHSKERITRVLNLPNDLIITFWFP